MLNGFDSVPDSPSKGHGAKAGEDDSAVDYSLSPAHKGVFVYVTQIQILKDGRHNKTHQKRQYSGDTEQDGKGAHKFISLEADTAKEEIEEAADETGYAGNGHG